MDLACWQARILNCLAIQADGSICRLPGKEYRPPEAAAEKYHRDPCALAGGTETAYAGMNENCSFLLRECCVCHRVNDGGGWRAKAPEEYKAAVSHGYCPGCMKSALLDVDLYFEEMALQVAQ